MLDIDKILEIASECGVGILSSDGNTEGIYVDGTLMSTDALISDFSSHTLNKHEFVSSLLCLYATALEYLSVNFEDGQLFYADLISEESLSKLSLSIQDFLHYEYVESKFIHILNVKSILLKTAATQGCVESYADVLYDIVYGLDASLEDIKIY